MRDPQKNLDYSLPPDVKNKVLQAIDKYYWADNKRLEQIPDEEYEAYPSTDYTLGVATYSSSPANRTMHLSLDIIRRKAEISDAQRLVDAVDAGIERAAETASSTKFMKGIEEDLRAHIIGKIPNETTKPQKTHIGRRTDTFKKYKDRVYYFIAVELHYIEAGEDILRAESRLERSRSRGR